MTDSVGARLRQARELRRLSLQEVSEATKVRTPYLQALENDDLSAIPSAAQARGFLRIYAEFLGVDFGALPGTMQPREAPAALSTSSAEEKTPRPAAPSGLWANLRGRLNRGRGSKPQNADDASMAVAATQAVAQPELPRVDALPQPASTEVKTKVSGTATAGPEEVKKNSMI